MNYNDPNQETEIKKGKIFLIWFIASMIALIVLADFYPIYCIIVFGQLFLGFGLKIPKEEGILKYMKLIFILVGLALIVIPLMFIFPEYLNISKENLFVYIIPIAGISLFIFLGLGLIILPIKKRKKLKEVCSVTVQAHVIENKISYSDNTKVYCPVYGFEFDKRQYEVSTNVYSNVGVRDEGTPVEIKINPANPEEFLINEKSDNITLIIGISFLIVAISVLIFYVTTIIPEISNIEWNREESQYERY